MRVGPAATRGITLLELMVSMVIGLIALAAVYTVFTQQSKEYLLHRENIDVTETLRGAATLLTSEIQHAKATRDFVAVSSDSLKLRSFQNAGVLCVRNTATPSPVRFGVWLPSGLFSSGTDDSAFLYRINSSDWMRAKVTQVWTSSLPAGTTPCSWTGGAATTRAVELAFINPGDTVGVRVGSAIRGFRMTTYSLVSSGGHWWLGRRIGDGPVDLITGPLQASGLRFDYYNVDGAATAARDSVVSVKVTLLAESFRQVRVFGSALTNRTDSVSFIAYLRN
jgi:prepilin-type N-terminal cleavage/methylation domain-containing protein